jgi:hypothetical protein
VGATVKNKAAQEDQDWLQVEKGVEMGCKWFIMDQLTSFFQD